MAGMFCCRSAKMSIPGRMLLDNLSSGLAAIERG